MLAKTARLLAWLAVAAVVFLTVGPQQLRPTTGVPHDLEHFLAFSLVGLIFGLGYPGRLATLVPIAVAAAAALETAQLWVPHRHARFSDFVVNALAACVGLALAAAITAALQRYGPRDRPKSV
jgi:VanZ family protein